MHSVQIASRSFKQLADEYCYASDEFDKARTKTYSVATTAKRCEVYKSYFGMAAGDQDKTCTTHVPRELCKTIVEDKMECFAFLDI